MKITLKFYHDCKNQLIKLFLLILIRFVNLSMIKLENSQLYKLLWLRYIAVQKDY